MAATDLVPCFYTGQDFRWETPVEFRLRGELHKLKKLKLGRFDYNGKIFLFRRKIVDRVTASWNGSLSANNLTHFLKTNCYGDKLPYEIPHAGDRSIFARHHRSLIRVSSRNLFNGQIEQQVGA